MPLIEVKAFGHRFEDEARNAALVEKLTDALVEVYGEEMRAETWVVLDGVSPTHWGFGGQLRT